VTISRASITFIVAVTLFLVSQKAPGDILLDGDYTAVGWGSGILQQKAIRWTPCNKLAANFPAPPYRLIKRAHECDHVSPAAFGLEKTRGSFKIVNLENSRLVFPEGKLGDRVDVNQTSSLIILRLHDRSLDIPKDAVATGGAKFVNYLSTALGLTRAGDFQASDATIRQAVTQLRVLESGETFGAKTLASDAAYFLGKLSFEASPNSEAGMLFVQFANSQSNRLQPPPVPADAHPSGGAFLIGGNGWTLDHIYISRLGDGAAFTLSDAQKYKYELGTTKISNSYIEGGVQILDSLTWDNVTFVNTRIYYLGAPVSLKNMHFIKCQFFVNSGFNGSDFLRFASADPGDVNKVIGSGTAGF
jgi:hypothetical protein